MSQIIVKNLPLNITAEDLKKKFSEKGTVTQVSLKYTSNDIFRQFAFVGFKEKSEAESAAKYFNKTYINYSKIEVSIASDLNAHTQRNAVTWSKKQETSKKKDHQAQNPAPNIVTQWAIKVTGLPPRVKKNEIEEFFKPVKCRFSLPESKAVTKLVVYFESEKEKEVAFRRNKNHIGAKRIFLHHHVVNSDALQQHQSIPSNKFMKSDKIDERPKTQFFENKEVQKALISETGRLFIRNLAYVTTEEDISQLFSTYGHCDVQLQMDKFTNTSKGFALVNFVLPENALEAYEYLDGTSFQGRLLHIVGGQAKKEDNLSNINDLPFHKKKEALKKLSANNVRSWNSLFVRADAVAESLAARKNMSKRDVLLNDGKVSVAAELATEQTRIVNETRTFLIKNGVSLDSLSQTSGPRSKSVLLVKSLPAKTNKQDLVKVFEKFDSFISRILLPPNGLTAIVEFNNNDEAQKAFKALAYRRFKDSPLFLEFAPVDVFHQKDDEKNTSSSTKSGDKVDDDDGDDNDDEDKGEDDDDDDHEIDDDDDDNGSVDLNEPRRFVFVKGLPDDVNEKELKKIFGKHGRTLSFEIKKRGESTTAFVEYASNREAEKCLKSLSNLVIRGSQISLKISDRRLKYPTAIVKLNSSKSAKRGKTATKILIKNVPFQASHTDLNQLFKPYPGVKEIRLPKKVGSGHRGFAFVEFVSKADANRAYKELCQNTALYGRRLNFEWSADTECVDRLRKRTGEKYNPGCPSKIRRKSDLLSYLDDKEGVTDL
ncbi:hypothetical protein HELRODRAFT_99246 [Helobdella robusta]|uniref:RRM domain-containing protein n=1 Tax=Helobdella robusta TaxID=6412 RepID=T1G9R7_HELRO|nr:hypothetical protein HELRODRAFT_99246 [Helobdella robusta]ESO04893.1 hypothetical protein HELRODRAFT_99246 [Helobdella robusta]